MIPRIVVLLPAAYGLWQIAHPLGDLN